MIEKVKIFAVCGSPIKNGNVENFLKDALKAAEELENVETDWVSLAGQKIEYCDQCNFCLSKKVTKGKFCSKNDFISQEIFPKLIKADAVLFATPVYISKASSQINTLFDRMRAFAFSRFRNILKNKVFSCLTVAWLRHAGVESAQIQLYESALCHEMIPVSVHHAGAFYGGGAVSSLGGTGKFDPADKLQVLKDEWGLNSGRCIVERMVEVARLLKYGRKAMMRENIEIHLLPFSEAARDLEPQISENYLVQPPWKSTLSEIY